MNARLDTPSARRKLAMFAALAILGGFVGYVFTSLFEGAAIPWEDQLAIVMAVLMIGAGVISAVILATRPSTVPKGCGLLQVAVMLVAGGMFLLPMFGPALATPQVVFGAVVVLMVLQSVANLMLWRRADEMLRRIMSETSALAFWALQLALFVYAAAERLGLVETITGWGLMGILMGVYFNASIIIAARRGIY